MASIVRFVLLGIEVSVWTRTSVLLTRGRMEAATEGAGMGRLGAQRHLRGEVTGGMGQRKG